MRAFLILFRKDMLCLWRARRVLAATFSFALLLVVVASFSFLQVGYTQADLKSLTPGIFWLVFLFSGLIGLNHSFTVEHEHRALVGVLLLPIDPAWAYLAKFCSNLLFLAAVQLLVLICHSALFGVELAGVFLPLFGITLLAAVGFTALGTLFSAIAVCTRGKEIILPLMLFPLLLPLIGGSVELSRELLLRGALPEDGMWLSIVCAYDVLALVLSWALFEFVVRE